MIAQHRFILTERAMGGPNSGAMFYTIVDHLVARLIQNIHSMSYNIVYVVLRKNSRQFVWYCPIMQNADGEK